MAPTADDDKSGTVTPAFKIAGAPVANDSSPAEDGERISVLRTDWDALQAENAELRTANTELEQLVVTDPKTGILNRRGADKALHTMVRQFLRDHDAKRHGSDRIVIAFIDLDGLKTTNDQHGHDKGDALLSNFIANVKPHVREGDPFARIGGDEFLVIMNTDKPAGAKAHFMGLRNELDQKTAGLPVEERTVFSIGFSYLSHIKMEKFLKDVRTQTGNPDIKAKDLDVASICEGLIKEADTAMYIDKAPRKAARDAKAKLAGLTRPAPGPDAAVA